MLVFFAFIAQGWQMSGVIGEIVGNVLWMNTGWLVMGFECGG